MPDSHQSILGTPLDAPITREQALTLLKGGAEGISEWNERRAAGAEIPSLQQADLKEAVLIWANLQEADLCKAHLDGAHLERAILVGAHLEGAVLRWAHLEGALLGDAHLKGADLTRAHLEGAILPDAHLEGAHLIQAHLEGANLVGALLEDANLGDAYLEGALLQRAQLNSANLHGADLRGAVLGQAHFEGANLCTADLAGAILGQAHLKGADLRYIRVGECEAPHRADEDSGWTVHPRTHFAEVTFDKTTQVKGIDTLAADFAGAALFKRYIEDTQYLAQFEAAHPRVYWLWKVSCDCGRSFRQWALWSVLFVLLFAWLYDDAWPFSLGGLAPEFEPQHWTWFTSLYFSAVTFTTLGFGDVQPTNAIGQILTTAEVFIGYVMLGGLISIFANRLARRA